MQYSGFNLHIRLTTACNADCHYCSCESAILYSLITLSILSLSKTITVPIVAPEVAAMLDVGNFIHKAEDIYGYKNFINDAGGSVLDSVVFPAPDIPSKVRLLELQFRNS
jgi:MoaA/NifB/PqqE/SkfB family radical SAM enzyme